MAVDDGRVVSNFIVQALQGMDITLYGDGQQTRSFCYVSDLIDGLFALMQSDQIGPINLGNPREFTIAELAEQVIAMTGSKSRIVRLPLPADDPKQRCPDITRARGLLGFEPTVSLAKGLEPTIAYFQRLLMPTGRGDQPSTRPLVATEEAYAAALALQAALRR
jgi:UDP-glucuronate decarboxylase